VERERSFLTGIDADHARRKRSLLRERSWKYLSTRVWLMDKRSHLLERVCHSPKINFILGDQAPGITPGDIIIQVEQKEHARFQRKGDDLYIETEIDLLTALGGGKFAIPHLDGRCLIINVLPGEVVKPGEIKSVRGEGMPGYILCETI
jgi:hypothetical protein